MLSAAESVRKSVQKLKRRREPLWERFKSHPDETFLAVQLRAIDDQIAEYNQHIYELREQDFGGRQGIRTPGLIVANDALSQLS